MYDFKIKPTSKHDNSKMILTVTIHSAFKKVNKEGLLEDLLFVVCVWCGALLGAARSAAAAPPPPAALTHSQPPAATPLL